MSQSEQSRTQVEAGSDGPDRRTVIRSAGVLGAGALGAAALAACGSAVADGASKAAGSVTDAAKSAVKAAEIPVGGGRVLPEAQAVITQPKAGQFKAFSAVCTHAGCIVADVSGGTINCGCHGSQFDIATGEVRNGPATQPLPPKSVTVDSTGVHVS